MPEKKRRGLTIHAGGCHNYGGFDFYAPEESWELGFDFLKSYLRFPIPVDELDHFELKNIAFLGPMASGKSTQIRSVMKFAVDSFPDQVNYFMTDSIDMGVAHADLKPIQLICIDDAANQNDSRLSGGTKRATQTQGYFVIRHDMRDRVEDLIIEKKNEIKQRFEEQIKQRKLSAKDSEKSLEELENYRAGGVIFIIWSFQHYTSIDVRYREFFDAIFIKSYSKDNHIKKLLNKNESMLDLLKDITRQNLFNNYEARRLSVGSTKAEDLLVLVTDYIKEKDFPIPEHYGASLRDEYVEELYSTFIEQPLDLLAAPKDVIYGYFAVTHSEEPEYQKYHINKSIISDLVERMKFEKKDEIAFFKEFNYAPKHGKTNEILKRMNASFLDFDVVMRNQQTMMELIRRLREQDVSWRKIGAVIDKNHATIYSEFEKYRKTNGFKVAKKQNFAISDDEIKCLNPAAWDAVFQIMLMNNFTVHDIVNTTGLSKKFVSAQYLMWCSTPKNQYLNDKFKNASIANAKIAASMENEEVEDKSNSAKQMKKESFNPSIKKDVEFEIENRDERFNKIVMRCPVFQRNFKILSYIRLAPHCDRAELAEVTEIHEMNLIYGIEECIEFDLLKANSDLDSFKLTQLCRDLFKLLDNSGDLQKMLDSGKVNLNEILTTKTG